MNSNLGLQIAIAELNQLKTRYAELSKTCSPEKIYEEISEKFNKVRKSLGEIEKKAMGKIEWGKEIELKAAWVNGFALEKMAYNAFIKVRQEYYRSLNGSS